MLRDGFAIARGVRFPFLTEIAAEIMEFPLAREEFLDTLDLVLARAQFTMHIDPQLQVDQKQGTIHTSLLKPFNQCAIYIVRYFTCEGRYSYLHAIHFKFLSCLRHDNHPLNVPHFMYHIFPKRAAVLQK